MLYFSKTNIRKIASNEIIYMDGLKIYRSNAVKNVTWSETNSQYRGIVKGITDNIVKIHINSNTKGIRYECTCNDNESQQVACKHIIAVLLSLSDYYKQKEKNVEETENKDEKIENILDYYERQTYYERINESYQLKVVIQIPQIIKNDNNKAYISIKVGDQKLYKVNNIKKFINDFIQGKNIILGKEFNYIQGENCFEPNSQKIIDYLVEIYGAHEIFGKTAISNLFQKHQVIMNQTMLFRLLKILDKSEFQLEFYKQVFEDVTFKMDNPRIKLILETHEEGISLQYEEQEKIIPLTEDGKLLFIEQNIYLTNKRFTKTYIPLYNHLGEENRPLIFKGENEKRFLEVMLPKINETMLITIPKEIEDKYITEDLKCKIYLDREKNYIKADLKFIYGDKEINPMIYKREKEFIILRQGYEEEKILIQLAKMGFSAQKEYFLIKDENDIYQFLTSHLKELAKEYQVYYAESFKSIRIKKESKISTSLRVKGETNLLEMEMSCEELTPKELKELFNSIKLKKKYYRMKDGNFLSLQSMGMQKAYEIMEKMDISVKEMEEDKIFLPLSKAFYLDHILNDQELIEIYKNDSFHDFIHQIMVPDTVSIPIPNGIQAKLRDYQITGFHWLKMLQRNRLGGILADDMGLGKTIQAIVYLLSNIKENMPSIVICPTSLMYNWQDEIENFAPNLKSLVISGNQKDRQDIIEEIKNYDVIITSYPLIRKDIEYYETYDFHTCFIDEAQCIKNPSSLSAKAVKRIKCIHRFALTGTPIENSLTELWSIFDFILPGYLSNHTRFVKKFEKPILRDRNNMVVEDLTKHIKPFILRRMKKDVLQELPPKIESKMLVNMTEEQNKIYLSYMERLRGDISNEIDTFGFEKSQMMILAALTRLRQICCHPSTFVEAYEGGCGKMELLMDILPDILENGHRVLIFSQFTSMLQIISSEFKTYQISHFYLAGSTAIKERKEMIDRFNNGEKSIFLISLKAGGTGLNLTGADTVIHYDPWWNPAVEEQATDRAYRIGQENSVNVIKLITKGTIEEKIYKLQNTKKKLADSVIETGEVFLNKLTKEELIHIFDMD